VVTVNSSSRNGEREVDSFRISLEDAMRLMMKMNGAGDH
jgi:hypothetical protein